MSNSVQMPALGESVTEGTVTRWLKEVGEEVEVDEPLLEVSTDKVDTEIPSPYAGTLEKILAEEDDVVEVGGDLAYIGDGSGASLRTRLLPRNPPKSLQRPRPKKLPPKRHRQLKRLLRRNPLRPLRIPVPPKAPRSRCPRSASPSPKAP